MRKTIPLAFQYAHEADPDSWRNDWPMAGRTYYIYFGGLWGGQPTRVARLREEMMEFAEEPRGGDNR